MGTTTHADHGNKAEQPWPRVDGTAFQRSLFPVRVPQCLVVRRYFHPLTVQWCLLSEKDNAEVVKVFIPSQDKAFLNALVQFASPDQSCQYDKQKKKQKRT